MDKTAIEKERADCPGSQSEKPLFAVIFGGQGREREIATLGAISFIKRAAALGYRLLPIYVAPGGEFLLYEGDPLKIGAEGLSSLKTEAYPVRLSGKSGFLIAGEVVAVKRAMLILHGDKGEDGSVQGALEVAGIDYVGADVAASAVSLDKYIAKCVARELKIPTLEFKAYSRSEGAPEKIKEKIERDIGYPVFIKPRRLGGSIGASAARNEGELLSALLGAFAESPDIVAERYLEDKRELEVAYYSFFGNKRATHPAEIRLPCGFYSFCEKYSEKSSAELNIKAELSPSVAEELKRYSVTLAEALGIRHFARFDYFLSGSRIYFGEVNTIPGMTPRSMFFGMLEADGVDFAAFLSFIFGDVA